MIASIASLLQRPSSALRLMSPPWYTFPPTVMMFYPPHLQLIAQVYAFDPAVLNFARHIVGLQWLDVC